MRQHRDTQQWPDPREDEGEDNGGIANSFGVFLNGVENALNLLWCELKHVLAAEVFHLLVKVLELGIMSYAEQEIQKHAPKGHEAAPFSLSTPLR